MNHSLTKNLPPPSPTSLSVYSVIWQRGKPITFEELVTRVQAQSPKTTRNEIAAELGGLITKQRVYLNQEETGFVASRTKRDSDRQLERAVMATLPARVQFP